jgi:hypothetical protein
MSTDSKKKVALAGGVMNAIGLAINSANPLSTVFGGTGTSHTFTQGSLIFAGAGGNFAENNTNLFWNTSSNQLYIGANSSTQSYAGPSYLNLQSSTGSGFIDTVTLYTNQDQYPYLCISTAGHNATKLLFDAYSSGFTDYSSSNTASFAIENNGSLVIMAASGTSQGNSISWTNVITIQSTGVTYVGAALSVTTSLTAATFSATTASITTLTAGTVTANEFIGTPTNSPYYYSTSGGL